MPEYSIQQWQSFLGDKKTIAQGGGASDSNFPRPMIYVKPDKNFSDYVQQNGNQITVTLSGTNSEYDLHKVPAIVASSDYFPTYRPNFFGKTGYYTIILGSRWMGYPPVNGTVEIQGLVGEDKLVETSTKFVPPTAIPQVFKSDPCTESYINLESYDGKQLFIIFAVLITIAIYVGIVRKNT